MATQTELTAEEVVARGKAIYQERIRTQVEPGNIGKYLAIDIHSGEYEMGDDTSGDRGSAEGAGS